ncbi:hypothetical protein GCK72_006718 [Caenorhabditis remanei]|uniref:Uncharacterized protein n=1 Tax=Caenorhabditis remanei TaxID=31234 RepID=A0A6A5HFN8_CAERE|nr:hypothetical protein GCK72_006718 [Caenorhabditis remanei]KAF1766760.1 hypothetical protein GCK72_006718 [Caenorhabditis remanei]
MSRHKYIDYIREKFAKIENNIAEMDNRCNTYERKVEENRITEERDAEHMKKSIMDQEWRDDTFRMSLKKLENRLKNETEKIESEKSEQQAMMNSVNAELRSIREDFSSFKNLFYESYMMNLEKIDENVYEKFRCLETSVEELRIKSRNDYSNVSLENNSVDYYYFDNEMKAISEWITNQELRGEEVREELEELRLEIENYKEDMISIKYEQRSESRNLNSEIEAICDTVADIHNQNESDMTVQEKFNEDVKSDLNKIGDFIKQMNKKQQAFEKSVNLNGCSGCSEIEEMRECLMRQMTDNQEMNRAIDELRNEMRSQQELAEAVKIKQELFNQSVPLEVRSLRKEVEESRRIGNHAVAELFAIRLEIDELKQKHEKEIEKLESENVQQQYLIDSLRSEVKVLNDNYSQFDEKIRDEFHYLHCDLKTLSSTCDQGHKESSFVDENSNLSKEKITLKNTSSKIESTIDDLRNEIEEIFEKLQTINQEVESIQNFQKGKFNGLAVVINDILEKIQHDSFENIQMFEFENNNRPIQEEIIGEWRLSGSKNVDEFVERNQAYPHEVYKENAKFAVDGDWFRSYFYNGKEFVRMKRKRLGILESNRNFCFIENNHIKSVEFHGLDNKVTENAERCSRYMVNDQLVVVNRMGGVVCKRVYDKIK